MESEGERNQTEAVQTLGVVFGWLVSLFWFFPPSSEGMQFAFGSTSLPQLCEGKEEM